LLTNCPGGEIKGSTTSEVRDNNDISNLELVASDCNCDYVVGTRTSVTINNGNVSGRIRIWGVLA